MKVIGTNSDTVICELSCAEWEAIGGKHRCSGYTRYPDTSTVPELREIVKALRDIKRSVPELSHIRASFQSFLMLTEGAAIAETLARCGVAEAIEEPSEDGIELESEA